MRSEITIALIKEYCRAIFSDLLQAAGGETCAGTSAPPQPLRAFLSALWGQELCKLKISFTDCTTRALADQAGAKTDTRAAWSSTTLELST